MWNKFLEAGFIKSIDLLMAKELGNAFSPAVQALLVHLSMAVRRGHLSIDPDENFRPLWELVERENQENSISEEMWEEMGKWIAEGIETLPELLIQSVSSENDPISLKPLVVYRTPEGKMKIYTQRSWLAESRFKILLKEFVGADRGPKISPEEIFSKIDDYQIPHLLPEQQNAILNAHGSLSIIAGGPGTGKTYTAGWMISILSDLLKEKLQRDPVIALAAPTGKAALHLENSVKRSAKNNLKITSGVTLHSLIAKRPLIADLIVIDEASMIDLESMNVLLREIPKGARLILMGDPDQLPPVGMGSIFVDMVQTLPHTHLKKCVRTDLKAIVDYANTIREGKYVAWENMYPLQDDQQLINYCVQHYRKCVTSDDFSKFKVLTPFSKGPFGTEQLNQKILQALGKVESIPVMITKNDYTLELFNGELGLWYPKKGVVQFPGRDGTGEREFPMTLIHSYQLGYCLTIHKSQGSEYPHVVVVSPEGSQIFGREALYTAVTRAKQTLEIFGSPEVLKQTIARSSRRS